MTFVYVNIHSQLVSTNLKARIKFESSLKYLQSFTTSSRRIDKIYDRSTITRIWTVRVACSIVMFIHDMEAAMEQIFVSNAAVLLKRR